MISTTQTTRISALLPLPLVKEVKKVSMKDDVTQSSIIKNALEFWLQNKLRQDTKSLSKINFNDLPSEDDWALIQPLV
ncbi:hypothetical protein KKC83_06130 [Patescibacteria group bacterium]|nr:hypothetical protein [Candidatus Falkowbacteria bacterium]MBU3906454.1 hypothetical protein [Patescibacteria group bacterium]MCG2698540.1 hypothetical protein [Candidatus Parcubacteria bacterium]MBU4014736.1 hypothetical protein [Patescibacteria group bacterium]MBU4027090.1 hypothetical protein [Patescibacteria group bacterium]